MTEATVDLNGNMDAKIWAAEFCKRWPSALCQIPGKEGVSDGADFERIMVGWFANAIMTGFDEASRRATSPEVAKLVAEAEARIINIAAGIFPGGFDHNVAAIRRAVEELMK
ncbi:MAG: hypothetical protein QM523_01145 [Candidatus Pacebacteria bacterium]|nr:hypothetical protein [Candidatus Paceibacterota bacterium]